MSKPRFKLQAGIDTLAHATTIKTNITAELVGKDIFEEHNFSTGFDSELNQNMIYGEWRFNNQIDRDAIREWIKDQIQNHPVVKTWILNAKLSWHLCTHDDSTIENCKTTIYAEFVK